MRKRPGHPLLSSTESWTLLAIALVLLYRFPDRLLRAQLWAEDGTVFLMGQRDYGLSSLWEPYSGYLHLLPRLVALFSGWLVDLPLIPLAYNLSALLLTLFSALFIMRARVPLPFKPVAAFALVFVPHPFEVYLTITSVQWMFACALPLFLLQTPAATRTGRIGDAIIALLVGLTGPFLLLFSPLLAYRMWREGWRERGNIVFYAATFLAVVVQAATFLRTAAVPPPTAPGFSPVQWLLVNGAVLIGGMLLGKNLSHALMGDNVAAFLRTARETVPTAPKFLILFCVGLAVLGGVAFFFQALKKLSLERRVLVISLLFCSAVTLVAAMRRLQGDPQPLGPFSGGSRYCFLPYVCLAWANLLLLTAGGVYRTVARALLLLEAVSTLSVLGPPPPVRDWKWTESVSRVKRGESVIVPVPPHGENGMVWEVQLHPETRYKQSDK